MAGLEFSSTAGLQNGEKNASFTIPIARGAMFGVSSVTGTMAAALGANSSVFTMRLDPGASVKAYVQRIRLQYTTIVAYTTPVTAGRRLALFRGSGAASSGGTSLALTGAEKDSTLASSECALAQGGDTRIATTAALTVTGITYETDPFRILTLSHVGAAGAFIEQLWEFHETECAPLVLSPGQLIGLRNPAAMDAAGTWQLAVNIDWFEV